MAELVEPPLYSGAGRGHPTGVCRAQHRASTAMPGGRGHGTQLWVSWTASGRAIVGEHWERHLPAGEGVTSTLQIGPGSQCESPHSTGLNGGGFGVQQQGTGWGMGLNLSGWGPHRWRGTGGLRGNPSAPRPVGSSLRGAGPQGPAQKPGRPDSRVLMRRGGAFSAHSGARGQGVCRANEPHLSVK